jgi:hypothetical protein
MNGQRISAGSVGCGVAVKGVMSFPFNLVVTSGVIVKEKEKAGVNEIELITNNYSPPCKHAQREKKNKKIKK